MRRLMGTALCLALLGPVLVLPVTGCGKSVGETIDDATITTRVKTALLNDPGISGLKIDVDTFKGVVTLSGSVSNSTEEEQAIAIARRTPGVVEVRSTLQISSGG